MLKLRMGHNNIGAREPLCSLIMLTARQLVHTWPPLAPRSRVLPVRQPSADGVSPFHLWGWRRRASQPVRGGSAPRLPLWPVRASSSSCSHLQTS